MPAGIEGYSAHRIAIIDSGLDDSQCLAIFELAVPAHGGHHIGMNIGQEDGVDDGLVADRPSGRQ